MTQSIDQLHLLILNVGLAIHNADWNWKNVSSPLPIVISAILISLIIISIYMKTINQNPAFWKIGISR